MADRRKAGLVRIITKKLCHLPGTGNAKHCHMATVGGTVGMSEEAANDLCSRKVLQCRPASCP